LDGLFETARWAGWTHSERTRDLKAWVWAYGWEELDWLSRMAHCPRASVGIHEGNRAEDKGGQIAERGFPPIHARRVGAGA
jgi:hypothetical protein